MVMLRMASTEEEERSVGHTPRAKNDSLPDVKVTIGAGHDLDDLYALIERVRSGGPLRRRAGDADPSSS